MLGWWAAQGSLGCPSRQEEGARLSAVQREGRWWLQNPRGDLLCACKGVGAVRHVLHIVEGVVFQVRAWEEPVVAEHVVPMTSGMAGETLCELILAMAESLCLRGEHTLLSPPGSWHPPGNGMEPQGCGGGHWHGCPDSCWLLLGATGAWQVYPSPICSPQHPSLLSQCFPCPVFEKAHFSMKRD